MPGRWLVCVSGSLVGGGAFVCRLLHKSISVSGVGGLCVCTRVGVFLGSMGISVPATAHMMDGGEGVVGRSLVSRTPGGVMAVYMGGLSRECWFLGEEESIFDPTVRNFHILRWGWDGEWGKCTVGVPPAVSDKVPPTGVRRAGPCPSWLSFLLVAFLSLCFQLFLTLSGYLGLPASPLQPSGSVNVALMQGASEIALFPLWL